MTTVTVVKVFFGSLLFSTTRHPKHQALLQTLPYSRIFKKPIQLFHFIKRLPQPSLGRLDFEENPTNITFLEGYDAVLDCQIELIEDKLVSWVRRKSDQLDFLTLGTTNHSSDSRISSSFKYPNNWRLSIRNTSKNDAGTYLCQVSIHSPKVLQIQLLLEGENPGELFGNQGINYKVTLSSSCLSNLILLFNIYSRI